MKNQEEYKKLKQLFNILDVPEIDDVLKIIHDNTSGQVYLVGGAVFRQIAAKYWDLNLDYQDVDFVAENVNQHLLLPAGWHDQGNSYGTHKITNGKITIDLWSYTQQHSIVSRHLDYEINLALSFTPLTIQSIGYDLNTNQVVGDTGLQAILDREVKINCSEQAIYYCGLKGITLDDFVTSKAKALQFKAVISELEG